VFIEIDFYIWHGALLTGIVN